MHSTTYTSLLATYPRAWRRRNGAVVLDTLLAVHAEIGRTAPSLGERARFAVDGVRVRLTRTQGVRVRAVAAGTLASVHFIDQTNGAVVESVVDERTQLRANAAELRDTAEERAAALGTVGMNAISR